MTPVYKPKSSKQIRVWWRPPKVSNASVWHVCNLRHHTYSLIHYSHLTLKHRLKFWKPSSFLFQMHHFVKCIISFDFKLFIFAIKTSLHNNKVKMHQKVVLDLCMLFLYFCPSTQLENNRYFTGLQFSCAIACCTFRTCHEDLQIL